MVFLVVIAGCIKPPVETAPLTPAASPVPGQTTVTGTLSPAPSTILSPTLTSPASAAAIVAKASQAVSNLQTYLFDRNISTVRSAKADQSDQTTTTIISKVALNLSARSMQMGNVVYVKLASGQMAGPTIENSIYIMNNTMYVQGLFPDNPQMWSKTALTETAWQLQDQAQQLVELLQPQNVTVLAPETLHSGNLDIPCDVLQVAPDLKGLWGLLVNQPGIQLPSQAPPGVAYSQIVKSSEMKLWLAQSNGAPVQAILKVSIQVDPTQVPSLTSAISMDINLNMLFYDYNQPVTINLPAEATATDVPDLKDLQKGQ